ncbi:MAG TPA: hypothetical protein VKT77_09155 [Chthonomonadaceae bacterium]|nr:hypothetical protein [Chthonomonadaceae bacterium]
MRYRLTLLAAAIAALLAATGITGRLHAQEPQDVAPPAVRGSLTDAGLQQMLLDMGYEPRRLKQGYVVAIKQGEWVFNVQFLISPNREKVGLNANVGTVEDPAAVTASQWMNVLASNTDIAPSFFYYNKANKTLYVHRVLDNRCLTAGIMRQQVEAFTASIKDSAETWKFTK